jgi:FlaA1/EpsC-like NDP-sugar epimerase
VKRRFFAISRKVFASSRLLKLFIIVCFDICSAEFSLWMALSILSGEMHWPVVQEWIAYLLASALVLPVFLFFGIYKSVQRFNGFDSFVTILKSVALYGILLCFLFFFLNIPILPFSAAILQPILFLLMIGGSRALPRLLSRSIEIHHQKSCDTADNILVYGAGAAGVEIVRAISRSNKYVVAGFIDDNEELQGRTIYGKTVFSSREVEELIGNGEIKTILLAIPSASRTRRNQIVEQYRKYQVQIKMLPVVEELVAGKVNIFDIKAVDIEDLLGRDPVPIDYSLIDQVIASQVVMVTGAGGSIGSELCRQLLQAKPSMLLLLDNTELNLYTIHRDLTNRQSRLSSATRIVPLLCDVTNRDRISEILRTFRPQVIYHAAAYKHVPMVEYNPAEGIRNNVFGTRSIAEVARQQGVGSVVLVSTDKAVRPTNIMGASKRLCEMILQALAAEPGHTTCFSMVRFGNVLGSSGSVVPLFRNQIKSGGPLTITHKEITRYFMTIPEAAQLVIQAGAMATSGDLFLLEMGEPVKIVDLAHKMIELSGLTLRTSENPDGDIEISYTGLRPGEKLYEELLIGNHSAPSTNPRIFKTREHFVPWSTLEAELDQLAAAINSNDARNIKSLLQQLIAEYQPAIATTEDLLAMEKQNGYKSAISSKFQQV